MYRDREHEIRLERTSYYLGEAMRRHDLDPDKCNFQWEAFADRVILRLKYDMMKQSGVRKITKKFKQQVKHEIEVTTRYPTTLWQMFKDKYLPKFFKDKFPVRYRTLKTTINKEVPVNFEVEVGVDVVYPKITLPEDKFTANFRVMDGHNFTIARDSVEL